MADVILNNAIIGLGPASAISDTDNFIVSQGTGLNDAYKTPPTRLRTYVQTAVVTTGVGLSFTKEAIYGSTGTPETGNITGNVTGALPGLVVIVIHNNGSAPTFDSKFKKLSGSGDYVTGVLNYIMCMYIDATHIIYSINQTA